MIHMTLADVRHLVETVLRRHGFSEPHVQAVAATIVAGERDGCTSHGVYRLPGCIATLRAGKVSPDARPEVFDSAPSVVGWSPSSRHAIAIHCRTRRLPVRYILTLFSRYSSR